MMPLPIRWDGHPIAVPGLYAGVPIAEHHNQLTDAPSVSRSGLWKIFNESPAHYFLTSYLNPEREPVEESEPMLFGRGAHHVLLGEADFDRHFIVRPERIDDPKDGNVPWNSIRNSCKAWLAHARDRGLTVLTPAQIKSIRGMAEGLAENPLVQAGILSGLIEHTFCWRDAETGVWLKIRPDAIPTDAADFSDLKTAADVTDAGIEEAIGRDGLAMQAAMTGMACREVLGVEMTSFSLVFAEKAPPHVARVKTLKPADIELGERQVRAALRVFARCLDTGIWPGPGGVQTDAEYVEMKPYHRTKIENRLAVLEMEMAA